jgi:hypothetical protein
MRNRQAFALTLTALLLATAAPLLAQAPFLPNPVRVVSTVPANGDLNPYGVAFVPAGIPAGGALHPGDILVSNFNNSQNLQGTGTTIVDIGAGATPTVFFQGDAGLGLSTALAVLSDGLVVVGNFPTTDGSCATAQPGSLLILDANGKRLDTLSGAGIDGPWDMTVVERPNHAVLLFVANALNGTVARLDTTAGPAGLAINSTTQIASGYGHRCDPAALVVAPTGLVYNAADDILYVASTEDNAVYAVHHAANAAHDQGKGHVIYQDNVHLHGALAMAQAPNGHLLVSNSDVINSDPNQPSEIVEFTTAGRFVKQLSMDPAQGGSFGLAVATQGRSVLFAAVDDAANTLSIWTLPPSN